MKLNPLLCITSLIALLLLQGCDKEIGQLSLFGAPKTGAKVKQVDMSVVIPIHPSSLEFFDYCICYADNTGEEYRDTVKNTSSDSDIHWIKDFFYKSLPIVCRCEVELIPKVSRDSVVSFSFITPKPYIFSRVIFNSPSTYSPSASPEIEGSEIMKIEDIRIGTFMSAYGKYFCSTCCVKEDYDGISCMTY